MPTSFSEIFFHLVWRISPASPKMTPPTRSLVKSFLQDSGDKFGYEPIALSVMDDHIHIVVGLLPGIAPGLLVETLKEEIYRYLAGDMAMKNPPSWDDAYGVVSISRAHLDIVAEYVRTQEKRHRAGRTNTTLERVR